MDMLLISVCHGARWIYCSVIGCQGCGGCVVDHWVSWGEVDVLLIGCQRCGGCVVDHWVSWVVVDVLLIIGCQGARWMCC